MSVGYDKVYWIALGELHLSSYRKIRSDETFPFSVWLYLHFRSWTIIEEDGREGGTTEPYS